MEISNSDTNGVIVWEGALKTPVFGPPGGYPDAMDVDENSSHPNPSDDMMDVEEMIRGKLVIPSHPIFAELTSNPLLSLSRQFPNRVLFTLRLVSLPP